MLLRLLLLAAAAFALPSTALGALPSDLDPSYGTGGIVTSDPRPGTIAEPLQPFATTLLDDGRVLVTGQTQSDDVWVARLTSAGDLDPAFGGLRTFGFGTGSYDEPAAIKVDAAGRTVVAGRAGGDAFLLRLLANGELDASFDGDGSLTLDTPSDSVQFTDLAVDADNGIYVVTSSSATKVRRYTSSGAPDATFGSGGVSNLADDISEARVFVLSDGRVVVSGSNSGSGCRIARIEGTADAVPGIDAGIYDPTFSGDGRLDIAGAACVDSSIDPAGALYLLTGLADGYRLTRVDHTGTVAGLDGDGIVDANPTATPAEQPVALVTQGSSAIAVTGLSGGGSTRFLQTINPSGGAVVLTSSVDCAVALGCTSVDLATSSAGYVVVGQEPDGSQNFVTRLDLSLGAVTSFGGDGATTVDRLIPWGLSVQAANLEADGTLNIFGQEGLYNNESSFIVRRTSTGAAASGGAGAVVADLFFGNNEYPAAIATTPDGQRYVTRRGPSNSGALLITRLTATGVDETFGVIGTLTLPMGLGSSTIYPSAMIAAADGSLLITGDETKSGAPMQRRGFVAKVDPVAGAFDPTFNGGAPAFVDRNATGQTESAEGIAILDGGDLLIGGALNNQVFAWRLTQNGTPAPGFGTAGVAELPSLSPMYSGTKVLVAGGATGKVGSTTVVGGSDREPRVVQLTTAGAVDPVYGTAIIGVDDSVAQRLNGMAHDTAGRLIIAGSRGDGDASDSMVARLNTDGTLDTAFAPGGRRTFDLAAGKYDALEFVGISGKRIVAAGQTATPSVLSIRLLGEIDPVVPIDVPTTPGNNPAASVRSVITSPRGNAKIKRTTKVTIRGTAAGTAGSVARVEVSIRQIVAGKCRHVRSSAGKIVTTKRTNKRCVAPRWIRATGTTSWKLALKRALLPGRYEIQTRATLSTGLVETPSLARSFTIKTR